ncbi:hypothetical protein BLA29_013147 [Euroglyphus maynei]|uniref:Uncharacterized protein n=1 Tax=Euroglyphus maynei TaxID=6958 RepID=A0A1Y3BNV4_EURMA|nr:hypothetical protein BLA29_013147 [Euroglyphus maynei]
MPSMHTRPVDHNLYNSLNI